MVESHARTEGARTITSTVKQEINKDGCLLGGAWKFSERPEFLKERLDYYTELIAVQRQKYLAMPHNPITITLPDGKVKEGVSFETTPLNIAKGISS